MKEICPRALIESLFHQMYKIPQSQIHLPYLKYVSVKPSSTVITGTSTVSEGNKVQLHVHQRAVDLKETCPRALMESLLHQIYKIPQSQIHLPYLKYISVKPSSPVITGTSTVSEGNKVQLQCTSTGCRPEGNMSWSFDGSITSPNVQNTQVSDTYTISSTFTSRTLNKADNGKAVTCRVGHESLTSLRTTSRSLNVQCK